MASALAINAVLLATSFAAFIALLNSARRHGSLLGGGE
jgi:ABC-2 type transport system permease protein